MNSYWIRKSRISPGHLRSRCCYLQEEITSIPSMSLPAKLHLHPEQQRMIVRGPRHLRSDHQLVCLRSRTCLTRSTSVILQTRQILLPILDGTINGVTQTSHKKTFLRSGAEQNHPHQKDSVFLEYPSRYLSSRTKQLSKRGRHRDRRVFLAFPLCPIPFPTHQIHLTREIGFLNILKEGPPT